MLETILAISGKPGLYRLVSRGNRNLIVETIDEKKKRMPTFATDKIISLADIAMYTEEKEVPLREVLNNIKQKEGGKAVAMDYRKAAKDELYGFLAEVLPSFDRDRVYPADVKKLIQWYNLLIENGLGFVCKVRRRAVFLNRAGLLIVVCRCNCRLFCSVCPTSRQTSGGWQVPPRWVACWYVSDSGRHRCTLCASGGNKTDHGY